MKYNKDIVMAYWKQCGINADIIPEYKFHDTRKWRLDFCLLAHGHKVAVEVQGGIFIQGRHSRGAAMLKEWEKLNELACQGYRVLYCQPCDVATLDFVNTIKRALS